MKLFGRGVDPGSPLGPEVVSKVVVETLSAQGLWCAVDERRSVCRVLGPPNALDPFLLTDISIAEGEFAVACALPLLVPPDRRDSVLDLCLWLNAAGRVSYGVSPSANPVVSAYVQLWSGWKQLAGPLVAATLRIARERAAVAEALFGDVAAGATPHEAVAKFNDGTISPPPSSSDAPTGARWNRELPAAPDGFAAPDGYTTAEFVSMVSLFGQLLEGKEIVNACAGPLLLHADGVVECYGCTEPGAHEHLGGTTVSCAGSLELGRGHRCSRCDESAAEEAAA